jgi:hypothetical protein
MVRNGTSRRFLDPQLGASLACHSACGRRARGRRGDEDELLACGSLGGDRVFGFDRAGRPDGINGSERRKRHEWRRGCGFHWSNRTNGSERIQRSNRTNGSERIQRSNRTNGSERIQRSNRTNGSKRPHRPYWIDGSDWGQCRDGSRCRVRVRNAGVQRSTAADLRGRGGVRERWGAVRGGLPRVPRRRVRGSPRRGRRRGR